MERTFGISEAAVMLNVSRKWIYDLVYTNQLRAEKCGGKWKIAKAEIMKRQRRLEEAEKLRTI